MTQVAPQSGVDERSDTRGSSGKPGRGPNDWLGGWRTLFVASAALAASFIGLRIYQGYFAWYNEAGLNSASPAFKTYWFSLFLIELALVGLITIGWWG